MPYTDPLVAGSSDGAVMLDIEARLIATRAFQVARLAGTLDDQQAEARPIALVVFRGASSIDAADEETDVRVDFTSRFEIWIIARHEDPRERFLAADRLRNVAANAIQGQPLAGLVDRQSVVFRGFEYRPDAPPDKTLVITGEYMYHIEGFEGNDESSYG